RACRPPCRPRTTDRRHRDPRPRSEAVAWLPCDHHLVIAPVDHHINLRLHRVVDAQLPVQHRPVLAHRVTVLRGLARTPPELCDLVDLAVDRRGVHDIPGLVQVADRPDLEPLTAPTSIRFRPSIPCVLFHD